MPCAQSAGSSDRASHRICNRAAASAAARRAAIACSSEGRVVDGAAAFPIEQEYRRARRSARAAKRSRGKMHARMRDTTRVRRAPCSRRLLSPAGHGRANCGSSVHSERSGAALRRAMPPAGLCFLPLRRDLRPCGLLGKCDFWSRQCRAGLHEPGAPVRS